MTSFWRQRWCFTIVCFLLLGLLYCTYSNYFHNTFHFDDVHVIEKNLYIRSLSNIPLFFTDAATHTSQMSNAQYRPLVLSTLAFDYWWGGGLDPWAFHVTQFVLLIALGILLCFFYWDLIRAFDPSWWGRYLALFGAAWFCLHVVNVEVLNIIQVRSELISVIAVVASFVVYAYAPRWRRYYLYLIPMSVGAFAKLPTVMFAPLFLFYLLLIEEKLSLTALFTAENRSRLKSVGVKTLPAFVIGIVLFCFIHAMKHPYLEYTAYSRFDYLISQPFVWLRYLWLFFLPLGLSADTDWGFLPHWYDTRFFIGIVAVGALVSLAVWCSRSWCLVAFGLAWFILALLPASSIFLLAEVTNDHRPFFAYIGLTIAVLWGVRCLVGLWLNFKGLRRSFVILVVLMASALLVGHAYASYKRNQVWRTAESLWFDVTQQSPRNGRGLMNYAVTQMRKGDNETARDYLERAANYTPNYYVLFINLGSVYAALGQDDQADRSFKRALQIKSSNHEVHLFYAEWLVESKRADEAIPYLKRAIDLSPADPRARHLLMAYTAALGRRDELDKIIAESLAIAPDDKVALSYQKSFFPAFVQDPTVAQYLVAAKNFYKKGSYLMAAQVYREATVIAPTSVAAYQGLGSSLEQLGFKQGAREAFERAKRLR